MTASHTSVSGAAIAMVVSVVCRIISIEFNQAFPLSPYYLIRYERWPYGFSPLPSSIRKLGLCIFHKVFCLGVAPGLDLFL